MSIKLIRAAVALLVVLGAISGLMRAGTALRPEPLRPGEELRERERKQLGQLAALTGMVPGTPEYARAAADIASFSSTYEAHRFGTFLHALPGALLLLLAPLQFSKRIRSRYPTLHRWTGRFLLVLVMAIGASAFYFGLFMPFGGIGESLAILVFGGLFMFSGLRAFVAIRHRQINLHREWMIRMFSLAIAITTIRLINIPLIMFVAPRVRTSFIFSLWLGWSLTLLAAELWIRHTRVARKLDRVRTADKTLVSPLSFRP